MAGFSTAKEIIPASTRAELEGVDTATVRTGELTPDGESRSGLGLGLLFTRQVSSLMGLFLGDLCNPFPIS